LSCCYCLRSSRIYRKQKPLDNPSARPSCQLSPKVLHMKNFKGVALFLGFGSIGQALAPVLLNDWGLHPSQIKALAADMDGAQVAESLGVSYSCTPLHPTNLAAELSARLSKGDILINVSVDVSSIALIHWCQAHEVLYLDTCVEPWAGGYVAEGLALEDITNHALRTAALALAEPGTSTAVIAHGANPGLISHLAKAGLEALADIKGISVPEGPHYWARVCRQLGVQAIHIAERDTQTSSTPVAENVFANTWSPSGLLSEAWQPAELGWGTHEKTFPSDGQRHATGDASGIYLTAHGAEVTVKSWVPLVGPQEAFLITHHESLSLSELLTVPGLVPSYPLYRPTVHYAYAPCPATHDALNSWVTSGFQPPAKKQALRDSLEAGVDQLGLLFVFQGGAYWFGSTLSLSEARRLAPYNNATSMQVVGGILGALQWMLANPYEGVVEAESLPHQAILDVATPYLGLVHGALTDWQPGAEGDLQFATFRTERFIP
jgi:homospermidine synthase